MDSFFLNVISALTCNPNTSGLSISGNYLMTSWYLINSGIYVVAGILDRELFNAYGEDYLKEAIFGNEYVIAEAPFDAGGGSKP